MGAGVPHRVRVKKLAARSLWILAIGVAVATLLGQLDRADLGEAGWLFDLLVHFPRQLAVIALIVALAAAAMKLSRQAGLATAVAALNISIVLGTPRFTIPAPAPEGAVFLRVVSANVHASPEALAELSALAQEYGADLVSIYEAPALNDEALRKLFPGMTTSTIRKSTDGRDLSKKMLAISARPISPITVASPGGRSNRAVLRYDLSLGSGQIQIVAAHPVSPDSPAGMGDRNRLLATLDQGLDITAPFIVMGDFNASPWSRVFGGAPGVRAGDPRFEMSFPAGMPPLGIPIDHIMSGGGLALTDYQVGPDIGSDHLPLLATFALPAN